VQVVALEPWSDAFLKEWLQETNQASDGGIRSAILEQTGGWPEFVYDWQPAGAPTIDADGEAQRRLGRLGLDDPHLLSALDGRTIDELTGGTDGEGVAHLIRWAELLGLLRIGGDAKVRVDPYVAELIMRV